jgi:hypothetical protein
VLTSLNVSTGITVSKMLNESAVEGPYRKGRWSRKCVFQARARDGGFRSNTAQYFTRKNKASIVISFSGQALTCPGRILVQCTLVSAGPVFTKHRAIVTRTDIVGY